MTFLGARLLAFAVGLFTVGAQAALLREYLVLFRGSELALGLLFFCWFGWIALAAGLSLRWTAVGRWARTHVAALAAFQPVGALAGIASLAAVRLLAGVPAWAPVPPALLALGAAWVTLPVGLPTGLVFPAACALAASSPRAGTRIAYVWEAAGAVAGGLLATASFAAGLDGLTTVAALGVATAAAACCQGIRHPGSGRLVPPIALAACVACLVPPSGPAIRDAVRALSLASTLPGARVEESVETPYHRVVRARAGVQQVVLVDGGVAAAFPDGPEVAGEAALLGCQPARNRHALVLGNARPSLAVALAGWFDAVTWVALDGRVTRALLDARAAAGAPGVPVNLRVVAGDPRIHVTRQDAEEAGWDLVVIAEPPPATRVAGRGYAVDFLEILAERMDRSGVVAAFLPSGENALVGERLRYGQSLWQTFGAVFPAVEAVPGETAVLLASPSAGVATVDPEELARRLARRDAGLGRFDPRRFHEMVRPDRAGFVREAYARESEGRMLVHSDARPLSSFLAMLDGLQQGGHRGARLLWTLFRAGPWLPGLALLVLGWWVFRTRLRRNAPRDAGPDAPGARVLAAIAGGVSIASSIVLIAQYQAVVGAVHRDVGAAVGLAMAGLAFGAGLGNAGARPVPWIRAIVLALAGALLVAALPWLAPGVGEDAWVHVRFGLLFLGTGLVTGAVWPVATALSRDADVAAALASWDHRGAAVLGGLTGVLLLPLYGTAWTCALLAGTLVVAAGAVALDAAARTPAWTRFAGTRVGRSLAFAAWPGGYGWPAAGIALAALALAAHLLGGPRDPAMSPELDPGVARRLDPSGNARPVASPFPHVLLEGVADPPGDAVALSTMAVASGIRGWGGPFNLAVSVGHDGTIRRVRVLSHRETPAYVRDLATFLGRFEGRPVRDVLAAPDGGVDAMTGATVTSRAMGRAVAAAGRAAAVDVLGLDAGDAAPETSPWASWLDVRVAYVFLVLAGALFVHRTGGDRFRLVFLALALAGGALLDVQLAAPWLQGLARGEHPSLAASPAMWLLSAGVLALAVLQGPIYCAHACPFGAAQELVSRLGMRLGTVRRPESAIAMRARALKYVLLAGVAAAPLMPDPVRALAWDPLSAVFANAPERPGLVLGALALASSLVLFRPWCRFACPVGAFLNLFNRVAGWIGRTPARYYAACDLGVQGAPDIDCLQCNRCVRGPTVPEAPRWRMGAAIVVLAFAVLVLAGLVGGLGAADADGDPASPGVRKVDVERVLRQIDEQRLSNRPALYWVPLE